MWFQGVLCAMRLDSIPFLSQGKLVSPIGKSSNSCTPLKWVTCFTNVQIAKCRFTLNAMGINLHFLKLRKGIKVRNLISGDATNAGEDSHLKRELTLAANYVNKAMKFHKYLKQWKLVEDGFTYFVLCGILNCSLLTWASKLKFNIYTSKFFNDSIWRK